MPVEKPPYKLVIDLETWHPDALHDTLDRLRELCDEHDQSTGELKTKLTIESFQEDALVAIRNNIESYLRHNKKLISGEAAMKWPLVRPKPEPTPMEQALGEMLGDGVDAVELRGGGRSVRVSRDEQPVGSDTRPY